MSLELSIGTAYMFFSLDVVLATFAIFAVAATIIIRDMIRS